MALYGKRVVQFKSHSKRVDTTQYLNTAIIAMHAMQSFTHFSSLKRYYRPVSHKVSTDDVTHLGVGARQRAQG